MTLIIMPCQEISPFRHCNAFKVWQEQLFRAADRLVRVAEKVIYFLSLQQRKALIYDNTEKGNEWKEKSVDVYCYTYCTHTHKRRKTIRNNKLLEYTSIYLYYRKFPYIEEFFNQLSTPKVTTAFFTFPNEHIFHKRANYANYALLFSHSSLESWSKKENTFNL